MVIDRKFLQKFVDAIGDEESVRGSKYLAVEFLKNFYRDHGREIKEIASQTRPKSRGPTVCCSPANGLMILVTNENPHNTFKEICLGAVIIACGKDGIREYGRDFSEPKGITKLFDRYPEIKEWHEKILAAFLG